MSLLFILAIVSCLVIAFLAEGPGQRIYNPLVSYYYIQFRFMLDHLLIYSLGIFSSVLIFIRANKSRKNISIRSYTRFALRSLRSLASGSFVAFLLLLMIAIIELNVISLFTRVNPKILAIETDYMKIIHILKNSRRFPVVVDGMAKDRVLVPAIAGAQAGHTSFYGSRVVPAIPGFLTISAKKPETGALIANDTLIITDVYTKDFQKISPVASSLLITKYFPGRKIRSYPIVTLMKMDEYKNYRKEDFSNKLKTFDELLIMIDKTINLVSANLEILQNQLAVDQDSVKQASANREKLYRICVNAGYYQDGVYIRTNSKDRCREAVSGLDDSVSNMKENIRKLETELSTDQKKLEQYKSYKELFKAQKILVHEQSTYVSYEFGTFNQPDVIQLVQLPVKNPQNAADYFVVLIHEYLHYASYSDSGKTITSSFFNEGLSEYFARNIVKDDLGISTNMGYPVNAKIINQMTKRITESDFADIYFSGDQKGLVELLDRVYGEGFYSNNIILFETIQYTSDTDQILKLANQIMSQINGGQLTKEDLYTTR